MVGNRDGGDRTAQGSAHLLTLLCGSIVTRLCSAFIVMKEISGVVSCLFDTVIAFYR
jgi:hypothetical protein